MKYLPAAVAVLAVFAAGAAFVVATELKVNLELFIHTLIATLLVGGGANAMNQYLERDAE